MKTLARDAFTELRPRLPVREAAALPPRLALRLGVATPVAVGALLMAFVMPDWLGPAAERRFAA